MTSKTRSVIVGLFLVAFQVGIAHAQTPAPSATDQPQQLLKAEELDQLVAPIALYPDTLLAEVLMASTYPLEVVQADRWATENKTLKGDQLKAAVDKQSWDDSVKSLVATPSVLAMMSNKLDWTQKLGDAVLAQQPDVMDAVQRLRTKAQANNKLASTKEQKVSVTQQQSKQVIVIEPAEPDTVYVPYYDPAVVYGDWPYPAYPPYYFPPPAAICRARSSRPESPSARATRSAAGLRAAIIGAAASTGAATTSTSTARSTSTTSTSTATTGSTIPSHRQGVQYNNTNVQQKFGNNNIRAGSQDRMDFRGRSGDQVIKPGGGVRISAAMRRPTVPALRDRTPGNRPDAGNRPSAGNRPDAAIGRMPVTGQRPLQDRCGRRPLPSATAPWPISNPAKWPMRRPRAEEQVSAAEARRVAAAECAAVAAAARRASAPVVAVGARGRRRRWWPRRRWWRWTSFGYQRQARHHADSAVSTMALASIASATTAATRPMSA